MRTTALANQAGLRTESAPLAKPMKVSGVGKHAQDVTHGVIVTGRTETGIDISYTTPVVPDSPIPALYGLKSMEKNLTVLDVRPDQQLMYIGGDMKVTPGPNTTIIQMHKATSGHLMIPITKYDAQSSNQSLQFHQQASETTGTQTQQ